MKVAVFWGCCIVASQYAYEMSVREVLPQFGVELLDLSEASCCGDPVKSVNDFAANYLSVRVLASVSQMGVTDLLVPCNRCHFSISEAQRLIQSSEAQKEKLAGLLKDEGLAFPSDVRIWHVIDLLHDQVGLSAIKKAVKKPLNGLKLVSHVGCQLIRYSDLGRPDSAENPKKLDDLIRALGAESMDYPEKLDCCGAALSRSHMDSALSLAGSKLKAVQSLGVDGMVVSCPECALMFDSRQKEVGAAVGAKLNVPVAYYTQLLGLALGVSQEQLGLHLNQSPVERLVSKLSV